VRDREKELVAGFLLSLSAAPQDEQNPIKEKYNETSKTSSHSDPNHSHPAFVRRASRCAAA
jgi:hypothetical protein